MFPIPSSLSYCIRFKRYGETYYLKDMDAFGTMTWMELCHTWTKHKFKAYQWEREEDAIRYVNTNLQHLCEDPYWCTVDVTEYLINPYAYMTF
jgi:hypothetical protein